jgi:hypothetical protein
MEAYEGLADDRSPVVLEANQAAKWPGQRATSGPPGPKPGQLPSGVDGAFIRG